MNYPAKAASVFLMVLVRAYQLLVSPVMAPSCRFAPSCSDYAMEALTRFGPVRGGWLAARRIARCHPWGDQGLDPVPEIAEQHPGGGTN